MTNLILPSCRRCLYLLFIMLIYIALFKDYKEYNISANNALVSEDVKIETVLRSSNNSIINKVLDNPSEYRVQILYTLVLRNSDGSITFKPYEYNVSSENYFYPASAIKLSAVLASMEKANDLGLGRNAIFTGSNGGSDTLASYMKKVLNYSDNHSFNILYDFLGHKDYNNKLLDKGFSSSRIFHKLYDIRSDNINNSLTQGYKLSDNKDISYIQKPQLSDLSLSNDNLNNLFLGRGHFTSDCEYIDKPMCFNGKNSMSIEDLQLLLKCIFFPEALEQANRFNLTADDVNFLKREMGDRCGTYKGIICGGRGTVPDGINIYNKLGWAYGTITDNSYIEDSEGNEFFLTATIYCNSNGIVNDGNYDYLNIGYPFLKKIGLILYEFTKNLNE
jgi:hypothetical protein